MASVRGKEERCVISRADGICWAGVYSVCEIDSMPSGRQQAAIQILKAGVLYFALVFGAGFVLGPVRIVWVVPRFGTRMAELMEAPIMVVVIIVSASWIVRRLALSRAPSHRLGMGCVALGLVLGAEFILVPWLRGISISEYLATRDPVSGTVYYATLVLFAIMPLLVARRWDGYPPAVEKRT